MFFFLIDLLWSIYSYIFIISIGNYITELMISKMQAEATETNNSQDPKEPSKQIPCKKKKKQQKKKEVKENTLDHSETPTSELKVNFEENVKLFSLNSIKNLTDTELKVNLEGNVKLFSLKSNMSKYYMVNDTMFEDTEPTMISDEEYHNYRLYKVMKTENERSDDELTNDDLVEGLFVTEEVMKQGLIINNNVFLSHEQWHTIRQVTKELYFCSVCQFQCEELMVSTHMRSEMHLQTLAVHPPLKRFDLSIIRKINENLHCAVCNVIFTITSYRDHEDSTTHEESLLSAINKVSDIMWDDQDNATTQNHPYNTQTLSFNTNNIREPNSAPCPRNNEATTPEEYWLDRHNHNMWDINFLEDRNTSVDRNIRMLNMDSLTNIQLQDDTSIDRNIRMLNMDLSTGINTRNIQMQNMDSSTNTQNMNLGNNSKDTKTDLVDNLKREHGFKFGKFMYKDVKIYEEDEIEEYVLPIEGISYAKMASKPVFKAPKYLKIDLGTKEVRVKFESWNMITLINPNEYYCMVCNMKFQVRLKVTHCMGHKELLTKCHVVGAFEDYLIRDIRGSLHCGICNILVPVNKIKDHNIEVEHTSALASALGMVKKIRPSQEVKYQREEQKEFPTDMDKFLSTLPPETRGALSKLKIKNHKGDMFQLSETSNSTPSTSSNATPTLMSINNSPIHTKKDTTTSDVCYPKIGAEGVKQAKPNEQDNLIGYPKLKPVIQGSAVNVSHPIIGAECNPNEAEDLIGYPKLRPVKQPSVLNVFHPTTGAQSNPNVCYPKSVVGAPIMYHSRIGFEGTNPNPYTGAPIFKTNQMLTVSMLEAGLTGSPMQVQVTGPSFQARNNAIGVPISPRSPEDIEVARARSIQVNSPMENRDGLIGNVLEVKKGIVKGKVLEKASVETHRQEPKKKKVSVNSDDEVLIPFKLEEVVFLKIKSAYFKVTSTSYHSLVHHGDGTRHCFVCSCHVSYTGLQQHVTSGNHIDKIAKNKFLYNCGHLFRQMYQMYHCAICNVTVSHNEIKLHLNWSIHIAKYEAACQKINKKDLKDAIKAGAKEFSIETQKEVLYPNVTDHVVTIVTYIQSEKDDFEEVFVEKKIDKKSQMIKLKGIMMEIGFDSWHGLLVTKNGVKCIICQQELPEDRLREHLETTYHRLALDNQNDNTFEKQYYPMLIRKINKNTVNCVICNLELLNDDSLVLEHIKGRKHDKNYNAIIEKTSRTDSYSDCYKNLITL